MVGQVETHGDPGDSTHLGGVPLETIMAADDTIGYIRAMSGESAAQIQAGDTDF